MPDDNSTKTAPSVFARPPAPLLTLSLTKLPRFGGAFLYIPNAYTAKPKIYTTL